MNDELYHHGIKGMKWGVRRYQNKDGSLTAKGKKHRWTQPSQKAEARAKLRKKKQAIKAKVKKEAAKDKEAKSLERYEKMQRLLRQGKNAPKDTKSSSDSKTSRKDISTLSNQELKTVVERMELERKYRDLTATPVKKKGNSFIKKELGVVADIAVKKLATNMIDKALAGKKPQSSQSKSSSNEPASAKTYSQPQNKQKPKKEKTKSKRNDDIIDAEFTERPYEPTRMFTGSRTLMIEHDPRKKRKR